MFTIRVVIETVKPQNCLSCSHDGHSILDTFVIVNGTTPFNKLVEFVLKDLGMPYLVEDSKGLIQINNWKPFLFEQITDNLHQPISHLLKDISSNLTLKVLTRKFPTTVKTSIPGSSNSIKPKINSFNGNQKPVHLPDFQITADTSDSPLLNDIGSNHSISDSSDNDIKALNNFQFENMESTTMKSETSELSPPNLSNSVFSEYCNNNLLNLNHSLTNSPNIAISSSSLNMVHERDDGLLTPRQLTSSFTQNNSGGRSRLMFDLLTEIPILEQWFEENPHPNWLQIEGYTNTLNEQPFRKNSTPMTTLNIKIWFKNRRARSRRSIK